MCLRSTPLAGLALSTRSPAMEGSRRQKTISSTGAAGSPWLASSGRAFWRPLGAHPVPWALLSVALSLVAAPPPDASAVPITYYFSTSGSDLYDGRSENRPMRSIAQVPSLVAGGNRALLKRGDVWHAY